MSSAFMVVFALMSLSAQAQGGQQRVIPAPKGPTPHLSDGKPDLSGVWRGGGPVQDLAVGLAKGETIPLLPEAEKLMKSRQSKDDPEANCLPTGVPRIAPYPWRILQTPTHVVFLFEGTIHCNGRPERKSRPWYEAGSAVAGDASRHRRLRARPGPGRYALSE